MIKCTYQIKSRFTGKYFDLLKNHLAIYWMNSQQFVVFLKHLLETDSSGVRGTETITPWNATGSLVVGWAPSSQEWQKRQCVTPIAQLYSLSPLQIHIPSPQHKLFPHGLALPDFSALTTGNSIPSPLHWGLLTPLWVKWRGVRGWGSSSLVRICVWIQSENRELNEKN